MWSKNRRRQQRDQAEGSRPDSASSARDRVSAAPATDSGRSVDMGRGGGFEGRLGSKLCEIG